MPVVPQQSTIRTTTRDIATGDPGIAQTLDVMARLAREATADPVTVGFARQLVAGLTPWQSQSQRAAAVRIRNWLWSVFRFVDDPLNRELLRAPDAMLAEYDARGYVLGDCDESATLGAALGLSVGIQPLLNVVEFAGDGDVGFTHVFASLLPTDGREVTLDITRPPRGTPVPVVTRMAAITV